MRSSMESMSGKRPRLLQRVLDHTAKVSAVVYLGALYYIFFAIGGHGPWAEHTRISEHALMPGLVKEHFDMNGRLSEFLKGLKEVHDAKGNYSDYICTNLLSVGVPCHEQPWRSTVALQNSTGRNVYGVVRAHRATGVESMLLAVDTRHREATAVLMAYAAFAREQVYWARDIFFVFVEGGALGMDAFLSEYHRVDAAGIKGDPLPATGGLLIGGVVLKSQSKRHRVKSVELEVNQLNGQLPNLDLFNSVVRIAGKGRFALHSVVYGVREFEKGGSDSSILVPLRALYTQAFTSIEGAHSVMGKYGVHGLTVSVPLASSMPLHESTRLLEAIARSMNNVLERFHQSYFMYVLASEDSFLSIAYYMPMMAVVLPLLFFAYSEWNTHMKEFIPPAAPVLIFHLVGCMTWLGASVHFSTSAMSDTAMLSLLAVIMFPWGLIIPVHNPSLSTLRFLVYLETALICISLSLLNFSLGLIVAILTVPPMIKLTVINKNKRRSLVRGALACLFHPLCLCQVVLVYAVPYLEYPGKHADFGVHQLISCLSSLMRNHLVLGSWLFPLLCCAALPIWNCLLLLAVTPTEDIVEPENPPPRWERISLAEKFNRECEEQEAEDTVSEETAVKNKDE